jgi:hypothetical protein
MHIPAPNPNLFASESIPIMGTSILREHLRVITQSFALGIAKIVKLKVPNYDGRYVEYWIALALTIPENSGNLDLVSKFAQVRLALPATIKYL